MRYFWPVLSAIAVLSMITFLFFAYSIKLRNDAQFTDTEKITEPEITIADPSYGPANAPVTIINFGDYECGQCAEFETVLGVLKTEYPDDLRIVWKDMPNTSQHKQALSAALAARCAGEQGKFWEYHELLMLNQKILGSELYSALATELELKERPFDRCLENEERLPLVERGYNEGVALDISATPTLFINGERYTGGMTALELRKIIDPLIK